MKDILVPIAYILAATVAGLFALLVNRKHPYEGLKTLVEIHKDLPDDMAVKGELRGQIDEEITRLTAKKGDKRSIIQRGLDSKYGDAVVLVLYFIMGGFAIGALLAATEYLFFDGSFF